jgi:hypothetical protein
MKYKNPIFVMRHTDGFLSEGFSLIGFNVLAPESLRNSTYHSLHRLSVCRSGGQLF